MAGSMNKPALWIILAAGLLLRASLLVGGWHRPQRFFTPDSHDYDALARTLIERGRFSRDADGKAEIFRTPGYPLLLAAIYSISGKAVQAAIGVQVLLDALLCLLVYRLAERLCSRRAGLIAAGFQAACPAAVAASLRLLSGSLFALLMTGALLALVNALRGWRIGWAALAGALMGSACLVRPIGLGAIVLAAVVLVRRIRHWRSAAAFAAAAAALVGPWTIRNFARADYAGLSGVGDYNLFYCNAAALVEADPNLPLSSEQQELMDMAGRPTPPSQQPSLLNDPGFLRRCRWEGLAIMAAHPVSYAAVHLRTTLNVFLPAATDVLEVAGVTSGGKGTLGVLRREGLPAAVRHYFGGSLWPLWLCAPMVLVTVVKYAAATAGALAHVRARMSPAVWLIALMVLYFALIPGPVAHARFRVPIEPLLSVAAGAGIAYLAGRRANQ